MVVIVVVFRVDEALLVENGMRKTERDDGDWTRVDEGRISAVSGACKLLPFKTKRALTKNHDGIIGEVDHRLSSAIYISRFAITGMGRGSRIRRSGNGKNRNGAFVSKAQAHQHVPPK